MQSEDIITQTEEEKQIKVNQSYAMLANTKILNAKTNPSINSQIQFKSKLNVMQSDFVKND